MGGFIIGVEKRESKRNSKFFVQLAAGKIWEKVPVALSIVEKRIFSGTPKKCRLLANGAFLMMFA
jgi:hypothetical protein